MNSNQKLKAKISELYPYIILFFISSILGWLYEVVVRFFVYGSKDSLLSFLLNCRGVLHGTWVPIYGFGMLLLAVIWRIFKEKKVFIFLTSIAACGVLEYVTAYILENLFNRKWWDYTGLFLNIQGRICFLSVFGFGIAGAAAIILIMPRYLALMKKCSIKVQQLISISLLFLFAVDVIYSLITLFNK